MRCVISGISFPPPPTFFTYPPISMLFFSRLARYISVITWLGDPLFLPLSFLFGTQKSVHFTRYLLLFQKCRWQQLSFQDDPSVYTYMCFSPPTASRWFEATAIREYNKVLYIYIYRYIYPSTKHPNCHSWLSWNEPSCQNGSCIRRRFPIPVDFPGLRFIANGTEQNPVRAVKKSLEKPVKDGHRGGMER